MAGKRPAQKGKTIAFIQKGSNSPPSSSKSGVKSFASAPVLHETNRGERTIGGSGTKRMFPPVYGSGKAIGSGQKTKIKRKKGAGYVPSSSDLTNSPNPF